MKIFVAEHDFAILLAKYERMKESFRKMKKKKVLLEKEKNKQTNKKTTTTTKIQIFALFSGKERHNLPTLEGMLHDSFHHIKFNNLIETLKCYFQNEKCLDVERLPFKYNISIF